MARIAHDHNGSRADGEARIGRHRLVVVLLALVMAACGGGGSDVPSPDGTAPPVAGQPLKVLPARLALGIEGEGVVQALASGRAVTWSSSDPGVASVDSAGRVKALAKGKALIRASAGADVAVASVSVYASSGANADPGPDALIERALVAGRIDGEQALIYRVYALFGDDRLPLEFDGPPSDEPNHALLRELASTVHTLSQPTHDLLRPFLLPPQYAESWYAQRAGLTAPAQAQAQAARATPSATTINCEASRLPGFFPRVSTTNFNIFYMKSLDPAQDAVSAQVVELIAALIEEVYRTESSLLNRFRLSDINEACNGGDAKTDIYYGGFALFGTGAWTATYPLPRGSTGVNACADRPSMVMLNKTSKEFIAIERSLAQGRALAKSIVAHEILHVLQFAMPRQASCTDTLWFDEATAQWAMDHVVPTIAQGEPGEFGMEPGAGRVAPGFPKSGPVLADYLFAGHMVPIEKPGASVKRNGYADYLFFQFVARAQTPDKIRQIFDALAGGLGSVEALAAAVDMKATWPDFARTLWIGVADRVLDYWYTEDEYRYGLAEVYAQAPTEGIPQDRKDKLKTLQVDQRGQPRATFELLKNALEFEGYLIHPRSMFFEHLSFSDATVHSVYFSNPIGSLPQREFMKVQALRKIGGQWQAPEDWTAEPYKQFCLDSKTERIEELLLIVSNSEARRGSEQPFAIPATFPMQLSTSNVGCWGWVGEASTETTSGPPDNIVALARATDLYFRVAAQAPGQTSFGTVAGIVSGRHRATPAQSCDLTLVSDTHNIYRGLGGENAPPTNDGAIMINLDLDFGLGALGGAPPDRKVVALSGSSVISTTSTLVCPQITQTSVGDQAWAWMSVAVDGRFAVSADGQVIEGSLTEQTLTGATIKTTWKFTALRE